jgi:TonB family protein
MADSTLSYERCIEVAATAFAGGDLAGAEQALLSAVASVEGVEGRRLELGATLIRLGALKRDQGDASAAEQAFARALNIGESLREDDPDQVIILNDLSRLFLAQGAHAYAEPLLLRLLALKRTKGEDHPEVATVLASLAGVRQTLGRHEQAEHLWRQVLSIRERTLAPNHFAIATTVEHLAEACAARAKTREALVLFQRALAIRTATLGADHPSLRSSRERIADLQLQAAEGSLGDPGAHALTPEIPRLLLPDSISIAAQRPPIPPAPSAAAPAAPPARSAPSARIVAPPPSSSKEPMFEFVEPAQHERIELPLAAATNGPVAHRKMEEPQAVPEAVPYMDVLLDIKGEMGVLDVDDSERPVATRPGALAAVALFLKQRNAAVLLGASAVVIPLVLVAAASGGSKASTPQWAEQTLIAEAPRVEPGLSAVAPLPDPTRVSAPAPDVSRDAAPNGNKNGTRTRSEEAERQPASIPTVSRPVVRLDSAMRGVNVNVPTVDPFAAKLASALEVSPATRPEGPAAPAQRPRVIGAMPTPKYPTKLLAQGQGGDVIVRFDVDTTGRPVMNSFAIVGTPNPLLTSAVREVIPGMRFEPARTAWPESKTIVDRVELVFRFNATRSRN